MLFSKIPSFFGMLGRGIPNQMPEQKAATRQGIDALAGMGVRKLPGVPDPINMSPTENAGNVLSTPGQPTARPLPPTRETPHILSTIPNRGGMAIDFSKPNTSASTPDILTSDAGRKAPLDFSSLPMNQNTPNTNNMIPDLNRSNLDRVARAPSRVGMLQGYKDELNNLSDPVELGNWEKNNRSKKGRIMDAILGAIRGFGGEKGQGAIAGYTGETRKRNEMNRVQEENEIARRGIMDRYGVDREILGQENVEENQYNAQRKQAFDMDKELNDQAKIQADQRRQEANDAFKREIDSIQAQVAARRMTNDEARLAMDEAKQNFEFQTQGNPGGIFSDQVADRANIPRGTQIPKRAADMPSLDYTQPDIEGNSYQYDKKDPNSAPKVIKRPLPKDPNSPKDRPLSISEIDAMAKDEVNKTYFKDNPYDSEKAIEDAALGLKDPRYQAAIDAVKARIIREQRQPKSSTITSTASPEAAAEYDAYEKKYTGNPRKAELLKMLAEKLGIKR